MDFGQEELRQSDRHTEQEERDAMNAEGGQRSALEILERWHPKLPYREAAQLLASGLDGPVGAETAQALLQTLNRMSIDLALVQLMLEDAVVARANVDPSRPGKWIFYAAEHAPKHDDLPPHDDVAVEEWM
jgi:hypothetical protein